MIKRLTWFVGGAAAGAAGAGYAKQQVTRRVRRAADQVSEQLAPANLARNAASTARHRASDLIDAVREGRAAMHYKEDELKARRDLRVETLDEHLDPGDQLLVDGQPVDADRVIVLKPRDSARSRKPRRFRLAK